MGLKRRVDKKDKCITGEVGAGIRREECLNSDAKNYCIYSYA